jgi:FG-GAP-like repeat
MLLGNGDGSLQGNDAIVFTSGVSSGVVGDFNGDASPDVVTADSSKVIVLLNDGSGKFIQAHSYPSTAQPIADGDLNHDGKLDLLLSTADNSSGTPTFSLSVMLGNGDGTFGAATSTGITGLSGVGINLIDLNGDQVPDLLVLTSQGVNVYLGKGDGTFSAAVNYFAGSTPTTMRIGDFNNDGKVDVAVGSAAGIGVLIGKGDGTFAPVVLSNSGPVEFSAVGDANGDGKLDLIESGAILTVYLGNGDGTFQAPLSTAPLGPADGFGTLTAADANGDGKLDVVAGPGLWFVQGNGDGTFASPIGVLNGSGSFGPFFDTVADFNGDGRPDALVTTLGNSPEQGFATFLNRTGAPIPNFAVAATAVTPGSVSAGGTAAATVTVAPANGFTANVALSCVGLPAGSSCAFAPASTAGGTSALTISVGSATNAGTYYVGVVGTGGGLTHSRLLTLDVMGTPDFAVSAGSGGSVTVAAGKTATYSLSLAGSAGFSGGVALTCSGAPTGADCSVSVMLSGSTPATATVSVTTTARSTVLMPVVEEPEGGPSRMLVAPGVFATVAALMVVVVLFGLYSSRERRFALATLLVVLLVVVGGAVSGCGGGSSDSGSNPSGATGTAAGNYTITVTATAGSGANAVTHTTKLTLVVQ